MSESIPLRALQRSLARAITGADEPDAGPGEGGASARARLLERLRADRDVPASDRLWIYQHAWFARIHEVLQADFPALRSVLGDDAFHDFAKLYAIAHPSRSFSLRFAGERFPRFLSGPVVGPLMARWPFAADLAAYEWTLVDLFDAPDDRPLERAALAALAPERWPMLRFGFVRAARLASFDWPVEILHAAWSADRALPAIEPARTTILFHRRSERVVARPVSALETRLLPLVASGADFGTICAAASDALGELEGPRSVLAALERWIAEGLLAALAGPASDR